MWGVAFHKTLMVPVLSFPSLQLLFCGNLQYLSVRLVERERPNHFHLSLIFTFEVCMVCQCTVKIIILPAETLHHSGRWSALLIRSSRRCSSRFPNIPAVLSRIFGLRKRLFRTHQKEEMHLFWQVAIVSRLHKERTYRNHWEHLQSTFLCGVCW